MMLGKSIMTPRLADKLATYGAALQALDNADRLRRLKPRAGLSFLPSLPAETSASSARQHHLCNAALLRERSRSLRNLQLDPRSVTHRARIGRERRSNSLVPEGLFFRLRPRALGRISP